MNLQVPQCCNFLATKSIIISWCIVEILFHCAVYLAYALTIGFYGYSIWAIVTFDILLIVGVVKENFGKLIRSWLGFKCFEIVAWIIVAIVISILTFGTKIVEFNGKDEEENDAIKVMTFVIVFTMPCIDIFWWIVVYNYQKSLYEKAFMNT